RQTMSSGPGFSESDQKQLDMWSNSPEAMDALYGLWQMRLADPGQIVRVLESAIIQSAKDKGKLHLVLRKINALVGVANDKNITVRIEAMLSSSLPIQRFQDNSIPETEGNKKSIEYTRTSFSPLAAAFGTGGLESETLKVEGYDLSDTHLNADEATGGVIFDGIDDVTVEFEIPNIDIPTFKRVTLWEAMQQVRVPIEDRLKTLPRP
ncbi:MAG: hypothetical protein KDD43_14200, partial [Bdellovibrionales bacterium]|nr:hypothetical protein [Bdellovibrionales bacterium]